jgi:hypothetical protein
MANKMVEDTNEGFGNVGELYPNSSLLCQNNWHIKVCPYPTNLGVGSSI